MRFRSLTLLILSIVLLSPASPGAGAGTGHGTYKPLYKQSIAEIAERYTLVGDFSMHPAERKISDEIFWTYPYKITKPEFPIHDAFDNVEKEIPATFGKGRPVEIINKGRILFLNKEYEEAKKNWLGVRAAFGTDWPHHRRNDYFIAHSFLQLGFQGYAARKDFNHEDVKISLDNASTFMSWAFIRKEDVPDPVLDQYAPKSLYNLAAIYWQYGRFAGAYGAAEKGLNFLRRTGRTEYRPEFLRISAEAHIQNKTYLDAVQLLDSVIRYEIGQVAEYEEAKKKGQRIDPVKEESYKKSVKNVASAFARIGDIYFDLRNYELAEDAYAYAARIDEEMDSVSAEQLILRGESLFWLGRFSEAQKVLHFALERRGAGAKDVPKDLAAWASLRHADAGLAQAKSDKDFNQTRLAYYKVWHEFGQSSQSSVANVRAACLELPDYKGNNVMHARDMLEKIKLSGEVPYVLNEVAWACQVASYTDRERTPEMLERVRKFADAYPESKFLKQFVEPVRDVQAEKIQSYLENKDFYSATDFFEKNRKLLFPKVSPELAGNLFAAYADIGNFAAAAEFFNEFEKSAKTDMDFVRMLAVASVQSEDKKQKNPEQWRKTRTKMIGLAEKKRWKLFPDANAMSLVNRIAATKNSDLHLNWLKNLGEHWTSERPELMCDFEYPVLSRIVNVDKAGGRKVMARLSQIVSVYLPDLFNKDESCGLSLLELENKILKTQPKELASRYLARANWPLLGGFLHLYWMVAEHLHDGGHAEASKKLLRVIAEKGPLKAPETGFAKARLDPTRTELEKLWD